MSRLIVAVACSVLIWLGLGVSSAAAELIIQHHELVVELNPTNHTITGQDTIQLVGVPGDHPVVHLNLHPDLEIQEVLVGGKALDFWEEALQASKNGPGVEPSMVTRTVEIPIPSLSDTQKRISLKISYRGEINDPPRAAPGLRFVRPDKTNGHIGEEGVYLTSETSWYPDILGSLATFHVTITLPKEWRAVTHGRETSYVVEGDASTAEWHIEANTEALTLAANRFVKHQRLWQGIELSTYLLEENGHLAEQYLEASAGYLAFYSEMLGPYPFPKFSVVENFFPSGLGLPSFTLLGSGVIRRGYTQPYSLGHEVVHSWLGNSVLNQFETGNWVEGLTTYLSNYYYEERFEGPETAVAHRQRMMVEYSLYSSPKNDYPVVKFHHKENRLDNAIGYQKTAMVFHMLRRRIGDYAFFRGVRQLVADYTGRYAGWNQVQRQFELAAREDLSWFFTQWVERPGAPKLAIREAQIEPGDGSGFWIRLRVSQGKERFRLQVPVVIQLGQGKDFRVLLDLREKEQLMSVWVPAKPVRLTLDPEFQAFRRLARNQIPPMLNLWATDEHRAVSSPPSEADQEAYRAALDRIHSQEEEVVWLKTGARFKNSQSVLAFGGPEQNATTAEVIGWCGSRIKVDGQGVTIEGTTYSGEQTAILVSCANPKQPSHVGTAFFGLSPGAVRHVARLLFFYGWDSYLVYQHGKVVARGSFAPQVKEFTVKLQAA
ncbi:M1 family metallopeptidase [Candidatus Nitronereus thalassa]|uniref:M1 family aminopeptidase n=1 Tax=Candidatus Nitronereus thalassa TaxID=3020898 RepID=A0ABU3KAF5_9BACT|nr:M1 family aminopeptidase [Candidatus Nitronereus thalassa]MDT7043398.1 M1 family aminopeptidase [Candidatus Nitronereus thalassa]